MHSQPSHFLNLFRRSLWVVPVPPWCIVLFWLVCLELFIQQKGCPRSHTAILSPTEVCWDPALSSAAASLSSSLLPSRRKGGRGIAFSAQKTNSAELPIPMALGAPNGGPYGFQV